MRIDAPPAPLRATAAVNRDASCARCSAACPLKSRLGVCLSTHRRRCVSFRAALRVNFWCRESSAPLRGGRARLGVGDDEAGQDRRKPGALAPKGGVGKGRGGKENPKSSQPPRKNSGACKDEFREKFKFKSKRAGKAVKERTERRSILRLPQAGG